MEKRRDAVFCIDLEPRKVCCEAQPVAICRVQETRDGVRISPFYGDI